MKQVHLIAVLLAASLILPDLTTADDNGQLEQVEVLFKLTRMEQKINESVESVAQLQLRQNPALEAKRDRLMAFLEKHIGWNAIRGDLTNMYMQTFTEQELKTMSRSRNAGYPAPPAQSRTCGIAASGSSVVLAFAQDKTIKQTPSGTPPPLCGAS